MRDGIVTRMGQDAPQSKDEDAARALEPRARCRKAACAGAGLLSLSLPRQSACGASLWRAAFTRMRAASFILRTAGPADGQQSGCSSRARRSQAARS
jgi:hypothetical protein